MERAYKFLLAGLAIGLVIAAAGTYLVSAALQPQNQLDCNECHAEGHGSVIAPNVNVNGTIFLTGDTPKDEYIPIDDIFTLKQRDIVTLSSQNEKGVPSRGVPVLDFLKAHGVSDFDTLVIYADDFALKMNRSEVNEDTIFVPEQFSLRVLSSNMPVATWLKGIRTIVVVGGDAGDAVTLKGKEISFGEMLAGGTQTMPVSLRTIGYNYAGNNYQYDTGFMVTGISLKDLLFQNGYQDFTTVDVAGKSLSRQQVLSGSYFLTRDQGVIKMATADKNRPNWPEVSEITVS
jgi:hypothetical protein